MEEGTLPEDVCICSRYPSISKSAISFLMVAGLTPKSYFLASVLEPTGSAEDM